MAEQTWTSIRQAVGAALSQLSYPYTTAPPDFDLMFPQGTSYAEGRIYREITPLCARTQNTTLTTAAGSRTLDLSAMTPLPVLVPEGVALIMPAGSTPGTGGVRHQYQLSALDFIDMVWPDESETLAPDDALYVGQWWAMRDNQTLVIAPTPDDEYVVEVTGLFQPTPISEANPTTYLSTTYPELFEAAIMVFLTGWLERNYGPQSSDPNMALSHEAIYQQLLPAVLAQENRMRGAGTAWTAFNPTPLAAPPRR